jgi:hypothetical protein
MLNNNVTLTVQLTDVNNAPKNADGSNKTYFQAGKENNYRGWVMNYKPESNLITITGTLVTHTDLVCQVNGLKDKYVSIKADSLNNQTRVTFCIKAPKGFNLNNLYAQTSYEGAFFYRCADRHKNVLTNFNKQLNSFVSIHKASSFVYSAATEEANASLTCFLSFDDLNFFSGQYSLVKKLTSLTRVTKTIALS